MRCFAANQDWPRSMAESCCLLNNGFALSAMREKPPKPLSPEDAENCRRGREEQQRRSVFRADFYGAMGGYAVDACTL
jgi:hypothetical protein